MKITALKQQVKNPQRVSIFVDGKYGFSLSLDELVKYKLKNNNELNAAELKKFKKISADGKLRARALEWLMSRPRSQREFSDYLYRKKTEPNQINSLSNEFTDKGYLDDAKFATWYVELLTRRGKSNRAIQAELFKKGISRSLADQALDHSQSSEEVRLKSILTKKQKLSRYQKDPQKLIQYLLAQGFNWQVVKATLKDKSPE